MEAVCAFTSVDAPDGRQKRLKVFAAAREFDDLDISQPALSTDAQQLIEGPDDEDEDGEVLE